MKNSIFVMGIMYLALSLCGCCACCSNLPRGISGGPEGQGTIPTSSNIVWDTSGTIPRQDFIYRLAYLTAGQTVDIVVKTNSTRVDFLIMNSTAYNTYKSSISGWTDVKWTNYNELYNITDGAFTFTAPKAGSYYFVVDNSDEPWWHDNARPTGAVWAQVKITKV